jgi:SAM-dependent methyltransferase
LDKEGNLQSKRYWDKKWSSIFDGYQKDLRHGHYVAALADGRGRRFLELGAGSFRDTAYLRGLGFEVLGIDFSENSCSLARSAFPHLTDSIICGDAFKTELLEFSVDVSFSKGFLGCFGDAEISSILLEQRRVTSKLIMATVHNSHNKKFLDYFKSRAEADSLYSLRFFAVDEIEHAFRSVGLKPQVFTVGKAYVSGEDVLIAEGAPLSLIRDAIVSQGPVALEISEYLMVVADVEAV